MLSHKHYAVALLLLPISLCAKNANQQYSISYGGRHCGIHNSIPRGGGDDARQPEKTRFWSIFRLNADAKEDATEEEQENAPLQMTPNTGSSRGGALTVVKKTPRQQRAEKTQQEETLEEPTATEQAHAIETKSVMKDMAARLWWANVWTQQLSETAPANETESNTTEAVVLADMSEEVVTAEVFESTLEESESETEEEVIVEVEVEAIVEPEDSSLENVTSDALALQEDEQEEDVEVAEEEEREKKVISPVKPGKKKRGAQGRDTIETVVAEVIASPEKNETTEVAQDTETKAMVLRQESKFISSGYWGTIDKVASLGFASNHPEFRVSRHLRPVRKAMARATGLHGVLSGKSIARLTGVQPEEPGEMLDDEDLGLIQRRIAAIERAKLNVERRARKDDGAAPETRRRGPFGRFRRKRDQQRSLPQQNNRTANEDAALKSLEEELIAEQERKERVKEIDALISQGNARLVKLQCEKDALQRRPNPLYNYSTVAEGEGETKFTREFKFPPDSLVDEYLEELFAHGRLVKLNHTYLWRSGAEFDDDEEETIGDDLLSPSVDAHKLYESNNNRNSKRLETRNGNGSGGSWLLRQSLGKRQSLGETIGESAETAAYKAVCHAVMGTLAKGISAMHGSNILEHSDIRVFMENAPDLPPVGKNLMPGSRSDMNYAQEAIMGAMRQGSRKRKKKGTKSKSTMLSEEAFIQRDAVVETLISHCQISAPLLKLFPLGWQRALLGNIITLIAAIVSDFCDGIQLQILGHALSFSFKPITESDMIRHIGMAGSGFNHRRARPEQFEAAVRATAEDVSESLKFLDRWHERALGSGMLRAQIANLIARIVLTLADEVLSGARMDLWSAQAGGPRMVAGLEYRTTSTY